MDTRSTEAPRAATLHPHALPKSERLRRRGEYLAVQGRGRKYHADSFVLFVLPRAGGSSTADGTPRPPRVGYTASKKVGNAVVRNRVRRLAREVFRLHKEWFPGERDLVFVFKRSAAETSYAALLAEVEKLCTRHFPRPPRQP